MLCNRFNEEVLRVMTKELKAIWEEAFSRPFDSLHERCKHYEEAGRDYIE
jgi:hypothetical protein